MRRQLPQHRCIVSLHHVTCGVWRPGRCETWRSSIEAKTLLFLTIGGVLSSCPALEVGVLCLPVFGFHVLGTNLELVMWLECVSESRISCGLIDVELV